MLRALICVGALLTSVSALAKPGPGPLSSGPVSVRRQSGEVRVAGQVVGKLRLPRGAIRLTHAFHTVSGRRVLHVRACGGERCQEMVLLPPPGTRVIFSGATGPQGVDGEWSRHVEVSESGVLLFQRRLNVIRCDGEPVRLFPKLYDFKAGRFRPVAAAPDVSGKTLEASRKPPAASASAVLAEPINAFRLVAASTQRGDNGEARNLAPPSEADDGDPATAWSESLGGAGQGEFLTARRPASPHRLRALRIIPGDARSTRAFGRANRLRRAVLVLSSGGARSGSVRHPIVPMGRAKSRAVRYPIVFPVDPRQVPGQVRDPFWVVLPRPVAATCATLIIESVYPGGKKGPGRTAISELRFFTELEFSGGLEQVARDLSATDRVRGEAAVRILARLGDRGVALVEKAARSPDSPPRALRRAVRALAQIRSPATARPLCGLLPRLSPGPRQEALDALVALGAGAVPHLAPLLGAKKSGLLADVAGALGRIGTPDARDALLSGAGKGSESRRKAVALGLCRLRGAAHLSAVLEAAEAARDPLRRADLVLVAGRLGATAELSRRRLFAARIAALWPAARGFEPRYRIIGSLGRLGPVGQVQTLKAAARDKDPVLRWTAVEQLRRIRGKSAADLMRGFLDDPDPRVRTSAALALSRLAASGRLSDALARRLEIERWPRVARTLAEGLGRHCAPRGIRALRRRVVIGPRGVDVRALISLAACSPPGLDRELLAMAGQRKWRTPVRQRALELVGRRSGRKHTAKLVGLLNDFRAGAARSEDEEALAVTAIRALGKAGGSGAARALADALALDPHESIRAAAATALSRLCQRSTRETLLRARRDASRRVRTAAGQAVKRCFRGKAPAL